MSNTDKTRLVDILPQVQENPAVAGFPEGCMFVNYQGSLYINPAVWQIAGGLAPIMAGGELPEISTGGSSLISRTRGNYLPETLDSILRPNGSLVGKPGSDFNIREMPGGLKAAQDYWDRLVSNGAKPINNSTYNGTFMELPNGGTIGFRTHMTNSPNTAVTIDVHIPNLFQGKLKFNK